MHTTCQSLPASRARLQARTLARGDRRPPCCRTHVQRTFPAPTYIHPHLLHPQPSMAAACHYQMGRIAQLSSRHDDAVEHYKSSLADNPLLWCAYRELCTIGMARADVAGSHHSTPTDPAAVDVSHLAAPHDAPLIAPTPDTAVAVATPLHPAHAMAMEDATPAQAAPTATPAQVPAFLAPVATPGAFVTPSPLPGARLGTQTTLLQPVFLKVF